MLSLFDHGPFAPCPSPFNLATYVLAKTGTQPDKPALEVLGPQDSTVWTFGQLEAAVRGTGTGLLQAGLKPGDLILMRLGNTVEFSIAYLGAIAAGLVPIPTSPQLTEFETAKIIDDLQPAAVLRDPAVACAEHAKTFHLDALQAMQSLPPCAYDLGDPERLAYAVFTSGTSGKARAVGHAHRAIWARQMMFSGWYGLTPDDRLLHAGAFNWTFTLGTGLMDPWSIGATALIPAEGTELSDLPQLLRKHRASLFAAAPGVYRKILKSRHKLDLPDLRHGLCAGEKLSDHLHEAWKQASGTELYEAYGMSECSTFISSCPGTPARGKSLGRPQVGRKIAILRGNTPAPLGEEGTIAIHKSDPGLMLGYLNAPEDTLSRMRGDWFLTGDQGVMFKDGEIAYLGRDDDMMNAGGFRVSPIEVETALSAHPAISQVGCAVVEIKEDTYIIVAFFSSPETVNIAELQAFASSRLAGYKQPRAYVQLDSLPTGANGKLLRRALPALFKG